MSPQVGHTNSLLHTFSYASPLKSVHFKWNHAGQLSQPIFFKSFISVSLVSSSSHVWHFILVTVHVVLFFLFLVFLDINNFSAFLFCNSSFFFCLSSFVFFLTSSFLFSNQYILLFLFLYLFFFFQTVSTRRMKLLLSCSWIISFLPSWVHKATLNAD